MDRSDHRRRKESKPLQQPKGGPNVTMLYGVLDRLNRSVGKAKETIAGRGTQFVATFVVRRLKLQALPKPAMHGGAVQLHRLRRTGDLVAREQALQDPLLLGGQFLRCGILWHNVVLPEVLPAEKD